MLAVLVEAKCSACLWRRLWRITRNGITVTACVVCDFRRWRWEDGE